MDEGRKRVLLIAASILAARKLSGWSGARVVSRRNHPRGEDHVEDRRQVARAESQGASCWEQEMKKIGNGD